MTPPRLERALAWLREAATNNWPAKVTALLLAGVLWAVVEAEEPTTQLVPVQVELDLPADRTLARPMPPVQALYTGAARELIRLYATPPVLRRRVTDTLITLTLTPNELVTARDIDAAPLDIQPRQLLIQLVPIAGAADPGEGGRVTERVLTGVPVRLGMLAAEWIADPPVVAVTVRGPAARVRTLTEDSLVIRVIGAPAGEAAVLGLGVGLPRGVEGRISPDSVRLARRSGG